MLPLRINVTIYIKRLLDLMNRLAYLKINKIKAVVVLQLAVIIVMNRVAKCFTPCIAKPIGYKQYLRIKYKLRLASLVE